MLLGYTLWGGVKEVAAPLLLALGPLLAWYAIEQADVRRRWILPGLSISAFLAVLGAPGAVWLVPTLLPLLLRARDKLGVTPRRSGPRPESAASPSWPPCRC